ncbi:MAG: MBL fold metallo-hydrolase [Sulfolobales archaeon]|nr:MBL fold metallo-hydrolase [Sulfolobales archaeon]
MVRLTSRVRIAELVEPDFFGGFLNQNVVVIERGPNGGLMLVDTGLPELFEQLEARLRSWGFSIEDVSDVVITHWHQDHAGNAERIRREAKAKVYAHELEVLRARKFNVPYEAIAEELKVPLEVVKRTMDRINKVTYEEPKEVIRLRGGEDLAGFKVVHVPGHTEGHIALFDGETLIAGDAIRGIRGVYTPPLRLFSQDHERAISSFNRLMSLPYKLLIPFHGEVKTPW